jgi:hypothetical protein
MNRTLVAAALILVAAGAAAWLWWHQQTPTQPPAVVQPPAPVAAATPSPPAIQHPVEDAPLASEAAPAQPVPLDHSDVAMRDALGALFSGGTLPAFFHPDRIVRNFVATVDALPRESVSPTIIPVDPAAGGLIVDSSEGATTIGAANSLRYALYVRALQAMDLKRVAGVYLQYYPLFQQAYRELGYPNGYFNDRLVSVIDLLLATPDVQAPVALEQPKVVYVFADPALQALPAGQKILLRMGPANATIVKARLRELRGYLVRTPPPR